MGIFAGCFRAYRIISQPLVEFFITAGGEKVARETGMERDRHRRPQCTVKGRGSKNGEPWVLPLSGRLWEIIQERVKARRLDCVHVFHHDGQTDRGFSKGMANRM